MNIGIVLCVLAYIIVNLATAKLLDAREMRRAFIRGQCFVGAICANLFYLPAWFLKGVRHVIVAVIK